MSTITKAQIDQALAELSELFPIEAYEDAIRIIKSLDTDDLQVYADDIFGFRTDTLHILIQASLLSPAQISRIQKVDDYIASHTVPPRLQPLQDWLAKNPLDTDPKASIMPQSNSDKNN